MHHDGTISWVFMDVFYTVCDIDVSYFPVDIQICLARFITLVYGSQMQFRVSKPEVDLIFFTGNGIFHLLKTDVNAGFYASNESYDHALNVTLYLERIPLFYAINLLAPNLLLVFLSSTVFLLPVEWRARGILRRNSTFDYGLHDSCSRHPARHIKTCLHFNIRTCCIFVPIHIYMF